MLGNLTIVNHFNSYSNSFDALKERKTENTFMPTREERNLLMFSHAENLTVPYSYVKHMNFLNFEDFLIEPIPLTLILSDSQ